jgi:3-oxoacyl-[acyl-carrier-protein] synthase-3
MKSISIGILGLSVYLPPEVRRNDWWSADVVARWMDAQRRAPRREISGSLTEGARRVERAIAEQTVDPFQSAVERRVMPAEMRVSDMEEQAARAALERAGVALGDVDLLLTQTTVPDYLASNPTCILHERLGLPKACFSMHTDTSSGAFMMQLTVADAMIRAGRARCALLVQSCIPSRLIDMTSPIAPLFGDAASAVVVGPVSGARGLEGTVSFTDGRNPKTLIVSVPGRAWYEDGRAVLHIGDAQQAHDVFLGAPDAFKDSVEAVLAASSRAAHEIDFLCIHQGAPWMRQLVQDYVGLGAARSVETFARTGYVFACTLPTALADAQDRGVLVNDDLVMLLAGGPGTTYGATILRWGA